MRERFVLGEPGAPLGPGPAAGDSSPQGIAIVSPHFLSVFQPLRRCSSGVEKDTPAALSGRRRDTPLPSLHLPHSLIHSRQGPPATRLSAPIAQTWNFISEGCGGPCDTTLDAFVFLMSRGETLLSAQRLAFLRSVFEGGHFILAGAEDCDPTGRWRGGRSSSEAKRAMRSRAFFSFFFLPRCR